jgi:hypothetical protein
LGGNRLAITEEHFCIERNGMTEVSAVLGLHFVQRRLEIRAQVRESPTGAIVRVKDVARVEL